MPNYYLSVLYKHIIQVENKNLGLKVGGGTNIPLPSQSKKWGGGAHAPLAPPPPPASYASVAFDSSILMCAQSRCKYRKDVSRWETFGATSLQVYCLDKYKGRVWWFVVILGTQTGIHRSDLTYGMFRRPSSNVRSRSRNLTHCYQFNFTRSARV